MYEELVKRLREHNGWALNETLDEAADAIEQLDKDLERAKEWESFWEKEATEALKKFQVSVASKPRWIPVTERLPSEELAFYLCYTDAGIVAECLWTNNKYGLGPFGDWGWRLMDVPQYQKVTHWMPLPEPPKEEAE